MEGASFETKKSFETLEEGTRFIYRRNYSSALKEDTLEERSPSGDHLKFLHLGWLSLKDVSSHYVLVEVLGESRGGDDMCPNCVTPWKCNGPHLESRGGASHLDRYLDAMELSRYGRHEVND